MKKALLAFMVLAFVAVNFASAEMVNIGLGEMEQSDFMDLKAKVQGQAPDLKPVLATPLDRPERYGMVAMTRADFKALQDKMDARDFSFDAKPTLKAIQMVNIGTGEMPMDEFIALKNMVQEADMFVLGRLAVAQP
jgi:hypothetical protein